MRRNFPISSQQFNDIVITAYGDLCYLLGYEDSDDNSYSGLYQYLEQSGLAFMTTTSGIPHLGNTDLKYQLGLDQDTTSDVLIQYLKFDYVYRKNLNFI